MILKHLLLCALLSSVVAVQAFQLQDEHCMELESCWFAMWQEQLQNNSAKVEQCNRYANRLVDFQDIDGNVAEQVISTLYQTKLWEQFVERRDLESTLQFVRFMIAVLQRAMWDGSQMSFPPQLVDIEQEISRSGLSEEAFCAKLRQAFLIFTIVVSQMDDLVRQEQV